MELKHRGITFRLIFTYKCKIKVDPDSVHVPKSMKWLHVPTGGGSEMFRTQTQQTADSIKPR